MKFVSKFIEQLKIAKVYLLSNFEDLKNILSLIFTIVRSNFILLPIIKAFSFINNIAISYSIYLFISLQKLQFFSLITSLFICRLSLSILSFLLEVNSRKKIAKWFSSKILSSNLHLIKKEKLNRLITRDFMVLFEDLVDISNLVYFVIVFFLLFLGANFFSIINVFILILSSLICIILSHVIAKHTIYYIRQVYTNTENRIGLVSRWVDIRKYLSNWGLQNIFLCEFQNALQNEILSRNKDSFWKCLDMYIIVFSGIIPVGIAAFIYVLFSNLANVPFLLIYWIMVPFVSIIMQIGRYPASYIQIKSILKEISLLKQTNLFEIHNCINFDNSWEIWEGTLESNILVTNLNSVALSVLGLSEELNLITNPECKLASEGKNISAGQRERILLLRALNLAKITNQPLNILLDFSSVDKSNLKKIWKIIEIYAQEIKINIENKDRFVTLNEVGTDLQKSNQLFKRNDIIDNPKEEKIDPSFPDLLKGILALFKMPLNLGFIFPSLALILIGVIIKIQNNYIIHNIIIAVIIGVAGIYICSKLGQNIENIVRKKGLTWFNNILLKASFQNSSDIVHRLTRDTTVFWERLTYYLHDLNWYFFNIVTSLLFMIWKGQNSVIGIFCFFIVCSVLIWIFLASKINTAQIKLVEGINELLKNVLDYAHLGSAFSVTYLRKKRANFLIQSENKFVYKYQHLFTLKFIVIFCSQFLSTVIILWNSNFYRHNLADASYLAGLFTSLFIIDRLILSFFQALTGFNAHKISYIRLNNYPVLTDKHPLQIKVSRNQLCIPSINVFITQSSFKEVFVDIGKCHSLVGCSGIGKSSYLREVARFSQDDSSTCFFNNVLYFDKNAQNILSITPFTGGIDRYLKNIPKTKKLIILDEALSHLNYLEWRDFIEQIELYIKCYNMSAIVADHRFTVDKIINFENLQRSKA